ncbi:SCO4225 family membrane protein [Streptomyces sp. NPDC096319]|uniref:SCO4225 family membrane protein n=1 Tax=Streptomyces sp. NPDC096319 TaxID=3366084 RepID=UPI00382F5AB3
MKARALFRLTVANPASAAYLGLVGVSVVFEVAAALLGDPGIVGIWPLLLTAPTSPLTVGVIGGVWGTDAPFWSLAGGILISALAQSFALVVSPRVRSSQGGEAC